MMKLELEKWEFACIINGLGDYNKSKRANEDSNKLQERLIDQYMEEMLVK